MTAFEAVGRGSIPRWGILNRDCPWSVVDARDPAKVVAQVRLPIRTLNELQRSRSRSVLCERSDATLPFTSWIYSQMRRGSRSRRINGLGHSREGGIDLASIRSAEVCALQAFAEKQRHVPDTS